MKFENKELRYEFAENLENLKEQTTWLQKCFLENETLKKERTKKYGAEKTKKFESDPSILMKLKALMEQGKFPENEKLCSKSTG